MNDILTSLARPETWGALLTLSAMEIVLGIDNVIFISIIAANITAFHFTDSSPYESAFETAYVITDVATFETTNISTYASAFERSYFPAY